MNFRQASQQRYRAVPLIEVILGDKGEQPKHGKEEKRQHELHRAVRARQIKGNANGNPRYARNSMLIDQAG